MTIQFISAEEIIYFHDKLLSVTPSVTGMSDPGRAEALLYRVLNKYEYEGVSDLWLLAAMHLLAISRGHIFNDGNKRTALFITLLFLKRNGLILAANPEFVELTVDVAAGKVSLEDIVTRLRQHGT
ncbi:TPA: type II toxin-antitoxin system death-on-curing family toxin [Escherichia coli]|nr:type II toxin-antitoxin system death-on-curing family toxin [Escherichia coli]EKE6643003.1 type II toxin-antitoxin system death-on-curing family toxin [Escherichia coli]HCP8422280.1 type II toxin-antitoxin system death-on-curing family toxin [Escherichia coli]HEG0720652.1 type II toxin-antitoxin system death-on-curing family toxin [Escherichia coli]